MTTVKSKPNPKSSTIEIANTKPGEWFEYRGTLFFHPKNRMKDSSNSNVLAISFDNDAVITEDTHCRWDKVRIVRSVSINED